MLCLLPSRPGLVPGARPCILSQAAPAPHGAPPPARTSPARATRAPRVGPLSQGRAARPSLFASRGARCPAMGPATRVKPFRSDTHACVSWAGCPSSRPRSSAWLATHAMAWHGCHLPWVALTAVAAPAPPHIWTKRVPWARCGVDLAFAPPALTTLSRQKNTR